MHIFMQLLPFSMRFVKRHFSKVALGNKRQVSERKMYQEERAIHRDSRGEEV